MKKIVTLIALVGATTLFAACNSKQSNKQEKIKYGDVLKNEESGIVGLTDIAFAEMVIHNDTAASISFSNDTAASISFSVEALFRSNGEEELHTLSYDWTKYHNYWIDDSLNFPPLAPVATNQCSDNSCSQLYVLVKTTLGTTLGAFALEKMLTLMKMAFGNSPS